MRWMVVFLCLGGLSAFGVAAGTQKGEEEAANGPAGPKSAAKPSQVGQVTSTRTEEKTIPYKTEYRFDRTLRPNQQRSAQTGVPTRITRVIEEIRVNGKVTKSRVVYERRSEGRNEVILIGYPAIQQSRGGFVRKRTLDVIATAYSPEEPGLDYRTASGMRAGFGIVAVDPRVIPLGTKVYVEGYGFAIAADTGGAIKGMKIDVCFNTIGEVYRWGKRRVKIHILE